MYNFITAIMGVIVGGLITIKVSDLTNTKLLKKEHQLKILQEVKQYLRAWSTCLLEDCAKNFERDNIGEFKTVTLCPALASAIAYFDTNLSALKPFAEEFSALRKQEMSLQSEQEGMVNQLLQFADEHGTSVPLELYKYTNVSRLFEQYADKINGLRNSTNSLVSKMDLYIETDVLK
jgi:hypothetical protein